MKTLLRLALVVSLLAFTGSAVQAGWGHRHGMHHGWGHHAAPYGYGPVVAQPGFFQSGGSVAQLIFGDQQPTIVFDGGSLLGGLGVDFELVNGGGDDGGGDLLPVRTLRIERTYDRDADQSFRLVRASELESLLNEGDDEDACDGLREKIDDLEERMDGFESSLKELKRLIKANHSQPGEAPEGPEGLPGGEVGELMKP